MRGARGRAAAVLGHARARVGAAHLAADAAVGTLPSCCTDASSLPSSGTAGRPEPDSSVLPPRQVKLKLRGSARHFVADPDPDPDHRAGPGGLGTFRV